MSGQRLAAAFYLDGGQRSLRELLATAGATDLARDHETGPLECVWATMPAAAYLDTGAAVPFLVVTFPESAFLAQLPDHPTTDEPAEGLVDAFIAACDALTPTAAVIATRAWQAEPHVLSRQAAAVAEMDARRLADEHFGLLYVSDRLAGYQNGPWYGPDREMLPTPHGWLVFSGTGAKRWW